MPQHAQTYLAIAPHCPRSVARWPTLRRRKAPVPLSEGLRVAHLSYPGVQERARGEDADRLVRDRQSAATLSALRSFKAGEFRPGKLVREHA